MTTDEERQATFNDLCERTADARRMWLSGEQDEARALLRSIVTTYEEVKAGIADVAGSRALEFSVERLMEVTR